MFTDLNSGVGAVAGSLGPVGNFDARGGGLDWQVGMHRPFFEDGPNHPWRGKRCVILNSGRTRFNNKTKREEPVYVEELVDNLERRGRYSPVFNATTLRKGEWLHLDQVVVREARYRLRAWADLAAKNSYGGFNGMSTLILEHETMSDPGSAVVDMDALTEGRTDTPLYQLEGLPLPITHCDFYTSARFLATSRKTGTPFDTTMGEAAGRRVAESIEKVTIGVDTGITYGGNSTQTGGYGRTASVYGYLNHPARLVRTNFYLPTGAGRSGSGWVANDTLRDVLAARQALLANKFYGPFTIYHSNDWDQYLDNDYILTGGNTATQTLRERIKAIEGIEDCKRLDFLPGAAVLGAGSPVAASGAGGSTAAVNSGTATYAGDAAGPISAFPFRMVFVQMTPDVARAVNGMDITTVQWESVGGMRLNFKVMAIQVPQLRASQAGNSGILDATAGL